MALIPLKNTGRKITLLEQVFSYKILFSDIVAIIGDTFLPVMTRSWHVLHVKNVNKMIYIFSVAMTVLLAKKCQCSPSFIGLIEMNEHGLSFTFLLAQLKCMTEMHYPQPNCTSTHCLITRNCNKCWWTSMGVWCGCVLWHINPYGLFNDKYIYIWFVRNSL